MSSLFSPSKNLRVLFILFLCCLFFIIFLRSKDAHAGFILHRPLYIGLQSGLVGYWTFDGNDIDGATTKDLSGNSNTGTLTNGPKPAIGKLGQGMEFDGVDDFVGGFGTFIPVSGGGARSVSFWLQLANNAANRGVVYWGNDVAGEIFGISIDTVNGVLIDTAGLACDASVPLSPSRWYHIVVVGTGNNLNTYKIFSDGTLLQTCTQDQTINTSSLNELEIARFLGGTNEMNGVLDDVRIYNRALSQDEIKRLYKIGGTHKINTTISNDSLRTGLVGHWTFDGNDIDGATAKDLSGNSNTGTLTNGPVRAIGKLGQALDFDGVNDYVDGTSSTILEDLSQFTYTAWIYPRRVTNVDEFFVAGKDNLLSQGTSIGVGDFFNGANSRRLYGFVNFDTTSAQSESVNGTVTANEWQFIAMTWAGGTNVIRLYRGAAAASVAEVSYALQQAPVGLQLSDAGESLTIGARINSGSTEIPFDGRIDDVRVYNRVLSQDEIKRLYRIGATLKINTTISNDSLRTGLVGHWTFDGNDIDGATAKDLSGNSNTGTLTNSPKPAIGKLGQGLEFDGVNDYVDGTSNTILDDLSQFTYTAWIYPRRVTNVDELFVAGKDDSLSNGTSIGVGDFFNGANARRLYGFVNFTTTPAQSESVNGTVTANEWQFIAMTWAGGTNVIRLYRGTASTPVAEVSYGLQQAPIGAQVSDADESLTIGARLNSGATDIPFDGRIDDVRVYNRVLSQDEIKRLYNLGR